MNTINKTVKSFLILILLLFMIKSSMAEQISVEVWFFDMPRDSNAARILLMVTATNMSDKPVFVAPSHFTLTSNVRETVNVCSAMYGMKNHFDAINLLPRQKHTGALLFDAPKGRRYTLNYCGNDECFQISLDAIMHEWFEEAKQAKEADRKMKESKPVTP